MTTAAHVEKLDKVEKVDGRKTRHSYPEKFPCGCSARGVGAFSLRDGRKICKCGKVYRLVWTPTTEAK